MSDIFSPPQTGLPGSQQNYAPGYTTPGPSAIPGSVGAPTPPATSTNVFEQIEGTAGYYEPAIYELLSFYSGLVPQPDELDGQFVPLTDVQTTNASQTLIFAVGILPPSSNVTGRLLDRSATLATTMPIQGGVNVDLSSGAGRASTSTGSKVGGCRGQNVAGTPGSNMGPPIPLKYSPQQLGAAISSAYQSQFGRLPTQQELSIYVGQSLRETSGTWPNNNPGYIGNYYPTAGKVDQNNIPDPQGGSHKAIPPGQQTFGFVQCNGSTEYYNSYNTPQAGAAAFVSTISRMGGVQYAQQGNLTGYLNQLHSQGYFTDSVEDYQGHFTNTQALAQQIGDPANLSASMLPGQTLQQMASAQGGGDGSQPSNGWQGTGSKNGSQASQNIANAANTNLNTTNAGQALLQAQVATIQQTLAAIQQMQNTPPLKMLVNPQSFKVSCEKIISDGEWGRNGPIVEHWGDNQDKIEASGKVAAFYSMDAGSLATYKSGGQTSLGSGGISGGGAGPGITRIARQYSSAYQNFLSLWLLYKNNGGVWLQPHIAGSGTTSPQSGTSPATSSQPANLSVLGSIYIYYDNTLYIGSFDSFNLTETETAPYTLEYNFSFTVRATFLLDNSTDYSLQLSQLSSSQLNPLQGLPSPLQVATTPGGQALPPNVNPQPAGGVAPPPGLTPQQYAQLGAGTPAISSGSFSKR